MRAPFQVLVIPFRRSPAGQEFAVLRRSDSGNWQFPAGGGEVGETPVQAAHRETQEEIGISGNLIELDSLSTVPKKGFAAADSAPDLNIESTMPQPLRPRLKTNTKARSTFMEDKYTKAKCFAAICGSIACRHKKDRHASRAGLGNRPNFLATRCVRVSPAQCTCCRLL